MLGDESLRTGENIDGLIVRGKRGECLCMRYMVWKSRKEHRN